MIVRTTIYVLLWLVLCSPVMAQGYYHYDCAADASSGFTFDEGVRSWRPTSFRVAGKRYTLRHLTEQELAKQLPFENGKTWAAFEPNEEYTILSCPDPKPGENFVCGGLSVSFVLNPRSLRYQHYYAGAYSSGIDNNDDTPFIEIGRCKYVRGPG